MNAPLGYWGKVGESVFQLESLPTGLLSYVLMEVTKTPVEEGLCTAVPCRLEFPTESRVNSTVTGYWINKNISSPTAPNQPSATRDDDTNGRFHIIWNLEERDCISLIHRVPESDNVTASAELGEQRSALLRENIPVPMSGDIQSHAMGGLERRNSRRGSGNFMVFNFTRHWVFQNLTDLIFTIYTKR